MRLHVKIVILVSGIVQITNCSDPKHQDSVVVAYQYHSSKARGTDDSDLESNGTQSNLSSPEPEALPGDFCWDSRTSSFDRLPRINSSASHNPSASHNSLTELGSPLVQGKPYFTHDVPTPSPIKKQDHPVPTPKKEHDVPTPSPVKK